MVVLVTNVIVLLSSLFWFVILDFVVLDFVIFILLVRCVNATVRPVVYVVRLGVNDCMVWNSRLVIARLF